MVIASSRLVEIITEVSSKFVILLFLIVIFLLLVGSFFQEKPEGIFLEGGWKTGFMVLVFVILAAIFLDAIPSNEGGDSLLEDIFDFLDGNTKGEIVGSVILLALIILFMVYITQDRKLEKKTT